MMMPFKAALEYTKTHNCMCRNTGYHPLTIDGKRNAGLEIYIQNGFKVPDWIIIPVGGWSYFNWYLQSICGFAKSRHYTKIASAFMCAGRKH